MMLRKNCRLWYKAAVPVLIGSSQLAVKLLTSGERAGCAGRSAA